MGEWIAEWMCGVFEVFRKVEVTLGTLVKCGIRNGNLTLHSKNDTGAEWCVGDRAPRGWVWDRRTGDVVAGWKGGA